MNQPFLSELIINTSNRQVHDNSSSSLRDKYEKKEDKVEKIFIRSENIRISHLCVNYYVFIDLIMQ